MTVIDQLALRNLPYWQHMCFRYNNGVSKKTRHIWENRRQIMCLKKNLTLNIQTDCVLCVFNPKHHFTAVCSSITGQELHHSQRSIPNVFRVTLHRYTASVPRTDLNDAVLGNKNSRLNTALNFGPFDAQVICSWGISVSRSNSGDDGEVTRKGHFPRQQAADRTHHQ